VTLFAYDGNIILALCPWVVFIVSQDDNLALCGFDHLYYHEWENRNVGIFGMPYGLGNRIIGLVIDQAGVLFNL
jgi:hypothetical protein